MREFTPPAAPSIWFDDLTFRQVFLREAANGQRSEYGSRPKKFGIVAQFGRWCYPAAA